MNPQIRRLFLVFAFLFVALIATSTYWLWRAPDLEARQGNPTLVVRQLEIKRGLILAADGRTRAGREPPARELADGPRLVRSAATRAGRSPPTRSATRRSSARAPGWSSP